MAIKDVSYNPARVNRAWQGREVKSYRKELWFNAPARMAFINMPPQMHAGKNHWRIGDGHEKT